MQLCGMVGERGMLFWMESLSFWCAALFPWNNYISFYHHWPSCVTRCWWDCWQAGDQPSDHVSESCTSADAEQVSCHMCWLFEMLLLSDNRQQQGEIPSA